MIKIVSKIRNILREKRIQRETIRQLSKLDERQLKDIGIYGQSITAIAKGKR